VICHVLFSLSEGHPSHNKQCILFIIASCSFRKPHSSCKSGSLQEEVSPSRLNCRLWFARNGSVSSVLICPLLPLVRCVSLLFFSLCTVVFPPVHAPLTSFGASKRLMFCRLMLKVQHPSAHSSLFCSWIVVSIFPRKRTKGHGAARSSITQTPENHRSSATDLTLPLFSSSKNISQ